MDDEKLIEALKALGHPVRLKIVRALSGQERNVGEIEEAASIGQPTLSQQLAVLRAAGLVETRREAKLVYYRLHQERLSTIEVALGGLVDARESSPPPAAKRPSGGAANFARLA